MPMLTGVSARTWIQTISLACVCGLLGCSTYPYQEMTTAVVDCGQTPPDVSDVHRGRGGPTWWTARCGDATYFCSVLHERPICSVVPEDTPMDAPLSLR